MIECLVCGNRTDISLYLRGKRHHPTYRKCDKCGFVFAHPKIPIDFRNAQVTPMTDFEYSSRIRNYELRFSLIEEYLPKKECKILDIGTSTGVFLKLLKMKGINGIGIEPNPNAAVYGKERYGVEILTVSLDEFDTDMSFDVITMFNVFEHVSDPIGAITKAKSLMNSRGILVLELPHIFTLHSSLSLGYWFLFEKSHNWFFSRKTLLAFLAKYEFAAKQVTFVPKVATFAKLLDELMKNTVHEVMSRDQYLRMREKDFYKFINNKGIKINLHDYLFAIFQTAV